MHNVPTKFQPLVEIAYGILPKLIHNNCGSHHFSFILKSSRLLTVGINLSWKTHPLAATYKHRFQSIHSEVNALCRVRHKHDLRSLTMVNIRLSSLSLKAGYPILRNSRPCRSCLNLLQAFKFSKVFYSTDKGFEKLHSLAFME